MCPYAHKKTKIFRLFYWWKGELIFNPEGETIKKATVVPYKLNVIQDNCSFSEMGVIVRNCTDKKKTGGGEKRREKDRHLCSGKRGSVRRMGYIASYHCS